MLCCCVVSFCVTLLEVSICASVLYNTGTEIDHILFIYSSKELSGIELKYLPNTSTILFFIILAVVVWGFLEGVITTQCCNVQSHD